MIPGGLSSFHRRVRAGGPTPPTPAPPVGAPRDHGPRGARLYDQDNTRCDRCGARSDLTQVCAPCGDILCTDCYRPWTALACGRCRDHHHHLVVVR